MIVSKGKYNYKSGVISKARCNLNLLHIFKKINYCTGHFGWVGILVFLLLQK